MHISWYWKVTILVLTFKRYVYSSLSFLHLLSYFISKINICSNFNLCRTKLFVRFVAFSDFMSSRFMVRYTHVIFIIIITIQGTFVWYVIL